MSSQLRPAVRLIGLGNIGFRHLQGLAPLAGDIRLEGYDPAPEAQLRAETEWVLHADAQGLFAAAPTDATASGLSIIATSTQGREGIVLDEVRRGARSLLIEKVAFTQIDAFARVQATLDAVGAAAFVNTPRRLWPLYQALADQIRTAGSDMELTVSGRGLSFACNSVHFIDLLQMLSGEQAVAVVDADVSAPWPARRPGYYEVWGAARFRTPGGAALNLSSRPEDPDTTTIALTIAGRRHVVEEASGRVINASGDLVADFGRAPYQSELSALYARPMLEGQAPALPTLAESALAHRPLLDILTPTFAAADLLSPEGLPIT